MPFGYHAATSPYARHVSSITYRLTHSTTDDFCLGQSSLSDTCPVCAHNPVSPELCKPNKALRITLKAFLRTEEKKREKERQATAPPTPTTTTPTQSEKTSLERNEPNGNPEQTVEVPSVAPKEDQELRDGTADVASTGELDGSIAEVNTSQPDHPKTQVKLFPSGEFAHFLTQGSLPSSLMASPPILTNPSTPLVPKPTSLRMTRRLRHGRVPTKTCLPWVKELSRVWVGITMATSVG